MHFTHIERKISCFTGSEFTSEEVNLTGHTHSEGSCLSMAIDSMPYLEPSG